MRIKWLVTAAAVALSVGAFSKGSAWAFTLDQTRALQSAFERADVVIVVDGGGGTRTKSGKGK